jgi:hypothetical protein
MTPSIFAILKKGPLLVGEVRGFKSEVGKKFDKSDKNAPPILFGVFKIHMEMLEDGAPVTVSMYPDANSNADKLAEELGLKRGCIVGILVTKTEFKDGQRQARCSMNGIFMLDSAETASLQSA